MEIRWAEKHENLLKVVYYLITLTSLGISALALYKAYLNLRVSLVYWAILGTAILLYIGVVLLIAYKLQGSAKIIVHSVALQVIPFCAAVFVFCVLAAINSKQEVGAMNKYERMFIDLQGIQIAATKASEITPFETRAALEMNYGDYYRKGKLVKISSNSGYVVRKLTHSVPYVVPKMEALLEDIAMLFQEKTNSKVRFEVTSVLRTDEDIAKLKKENVNASSDSCHRYATTVDISYVRFSKKLMSNQKDSDLRLALAQTLHELREAGICYVKFEKNQCCYHVTVR